jgi:broad specificity phosphatase PhoE
MRPKDAICIFLTRHGETVWNVQHRIQGSKDSPLTARGVRQARQLARQLKDVMLTHIYSSPLARARKTAGIVARQHGLTVKTDRGFRERGFGIFDGLDRAEAERKGLPSRADINWRPPRGESLRACMARVLAAFRRILRRHKAGDRILIISHGCALRCLVHRLHGGKPEDFWDTKPIDNAEIVEVHHGRGKTRIVAARQ